MRPFFHTEIISSLKILRHPTASLDLPLNFIQEEQQTKLLLFLYVFSAELIVS